MLSPNGLSMFLRLRILVEFPAVVMLLLMASVIASMTLSSAVFELVSRLFVNVKLLISVESLFLV